MTDTSVPPEKIKEHLRKMLGTKSIPLSLESILCLSLPDSPAGVILKVCGVSPGPGLASAETEVEVILPTDPELALEAHWQEHGHSRISEEGDSVYIPPFMTHQHFNSDPENPARIITATNRIFKAMGFDWQEQVEPFPAYRG